jgi:DNA-binding HxlR family transcriptional regulator
MLKLMLVEDGKVLLEMPLSMKSWDRRELKQELDGFDEQIESMSGLFRVLSNEGRMRMMSAFFESEDRNMAFTELMNELGMNPKLIWDSTKRLSRSGLIEKDDEGRYLPTREGEAQFLVLGVAMRHIMQILREM